jgi:ATP-dependent Clp protease, protease subunit
MPPASPPAGPADWLGGHLFARRVVMLSGDVDTRIGDVIAQLLTMDAEGDEAIELYLDGTGQDVGAALSLMDVIDMLGVEVHATVMGRADGTAVGVLAVCPVRRVAPNARVTLREPRFQFSAAARDVATWSQYLGRQLDSFIDRLASACRSEASKVRADLERVVILDAGEAVAYGLADSVTSQLRVVEGNSET